MIKKNKLYFIIFLILLLNYPIDGQCLSPPLTTQTVSPPDRMQEISTRKLQELEMYAALGKSFAGIAHDINNGFTAISGYAGCFEITGKEIQVKWKQLREKVETLQKKGPPSYFELLEIYYLLIKDFADKKLNLEVEGFEEDATFISKTILDLGAMLKDFMLLARNGGEPISSVGITSVDGPLEKALRLLEHDMIKGRVLVKKFYPIVENEYMVDGYAVRLLRVFHNIFKNACEVLHKRDKREITISVFDELHVIRGKPVDCVIVCIEDTGPGIPEDKLKEVFGLFTTTKHDYGMGIGLANCRKIITQDHHGLIFVKNKKFQGVIFQIILPKIYEINAVGENVQVFDHCFISA